MGESVRPEDLAALSGPGGAVLVERDVVRVAGPDAAAYLQGQLSQDIAPLAVGEGAWTLVLSPQGKVDAWCRVTREGEDAYALDVDPGHGDALATRLTRFLLRTDATVSSGTRPMVAVRAAAGRPAHQLAADLLPGGVPDGVLVADPSWPAVGGVDLVGATTLPEGVPACAPPAIERLRIESGVPAMGAELTERTIPAEAGIVGRSVSFTKGCYTGQELVARIDSRGGNVARHLRRVVADGAVTLTPGTELVVGDGVVGALTSVAPAMAGAPTVALAYVGRAVEVPATAAVEGHPVTVEALPTDAGAGS